MAFVQVNTAIQEWLPDSLIPELISFFLNRDRQRLSS